MKNIEQKLKALFEYQRFQKNEKLEEMIKEAEGARVIELSDEELSFVNAAGEVICDEPEGIVKTGATQDTFGGRK